MFLEDVNRLNLAINLFDCQSRIRSPGIFCSTGQFRELLELGEMAAAGRSINTENTQLAGPERWHYQRNFQSDQCPVLVKKKKKSKGSTAASLQWLELLWW